MTHSYSKWRMYKKCQRMWAYASVVGNGKAKDARRKGISILSSLQTLSAWRGEIVDYTISNYYIRQLNKDICPNFDEILKYARQLCRKRYDFAKAKKYWKEGLVKSKCKDEYSALFELEFGKDIPKKDFIKAWEEIEISLANFFADKELIDLS